MKHAIERRIMSNTLNSVLLLAGRILLALIFLLAGIGKLVDWSATERMMTDHGMIGVSFLLPAAAFLEISGGLALLAGWATRPAAFALFLFLIPTTLIFHNFWAYDGLAQQNQMQNFMKNLAIMGGLLELAAAGAGAYAIDALNSFSKWRMTRSRPTF
jgi:putative oxidoreductase